MGGVHAKRAGQQPSDPSRPQAAVGTRSKKEGPGTACPGLERLAELENFVPNSTNRKPFDAYEGQSEAELRKGE